jgi:hypothetical protein
VTVLNGAAAFAGSGRLGADLEYTVQRLSKLNAYAALSLTDARVSKLNAYAVLLKVPWQGAAALAASGGMTANATGPIAAAAALAGSGAMTASATVRPPSLAQAGAGVLLIGV